MSQDQFDIAIHKTIRSGKRSFRLDVNIASASARLVIAGPSGAGKSLTLKAIAGLLTPDQGHIRVRGETLFDSAQGINTSPQARRLAYVFQDYALFPHLNVRQNIAFGLSTGWRNPGTNVEHPDLTRWLQAFQLEQVAHQFPDQLSGGQRQRTALARALVGKPRALLLDEPFAALDTALRASLRDELRDVLQELAMPMILITHDESDVRALGGDVVHLADGKVAARSSTEAP
ncbi:MAG: sulfate/molybdate ABC transporter ATP-binding protein [Massilia sp.]